MPNTPSRPRQVDLRRAMSSAYYAMFHALCKTVADAFIGAPSPDRCERAWLQTYRSVNHGFAKSACDRCSSSNYNFPQEIRDFASLFRTLQELRHEADYNPSVEFNKPDVISQIASADQAIRDLQNVGSRHKGAFAAMMLFTLRT